jgi:hypothetical protein
VKQGVEVEGRQAGAGGKQRGGRQAGTRTGVCCGSLDSLDSSECASSAIIRSVKPRIGSCEVGQTSIIRQSNLAITGVILPSSACRVSSTSSSACTQTASTGTGTHTELFLSSWAACTAEWINTTDERERNHKGGRVAARTRSVWSTIRKWVLFLSFPCICPEPVLVPRK